MPLRVALFVFLSAFVSPAFTQATCETALLLTDSIALPASTEHTWVKIPAAQAGSFRLNNSLKDVSYVIYYADSGFCSQVKHPAGVYVGSSEISPVLLAEAIKTGKCLCSSCIRIAPELSAIYDVYLKIEPHSNSFNITRTLIVKDQRPDSLQKDIKAGTKVAVTNILFQPNSNVFLPESKQPLEILYIFMRKNPGIKIEIQGHVNAPGPQVPEDQILSEKRAKAIYDYLIKEGITKDRVSYKGFGNQYMIYPKPKNEFQMMMNRRVEILILENKQVTTGG